MEVETPRVPTKTKRTYNLSARTVHRVRELAGSGRVAGSQDHVVEVAVDRLYDEVREEEEAARWAAAAGDPQFRREMAQIEADFRDREGWPG